MTTADATKQLTGDLKAVARDAEQLLKDTASLAGEKINDARSRLATALESAKATAHEVEEKTVAAAKAADRCIRTHPYETVGVAFGLGVLVGVLLTRK